LRGLREGKGEGSTKQKFIMIARINDFLFSNNFLKKKGKKKKTEIIIGLLKTEAKFLSFWVMEFSRGLELQGDCCCCCSSSSSSSSTEASPVASKKVQS
jgi:hypothetical protein